MSKRLDAETVDRQCREMWDALADCPRDEHYNAAWKEAGEIERKMRAELRRQQRLDVLAPRMEDALRELVATFDTYDNTQSECDLIAKARAVLAEIDKEA